ncbi:MAG: FAD-dependent oxidoreductase [Verrucomicrobia bacterium]|nr:FAD-dependent oxidoreductase [Verrucomicrobiota bacterium]MCH8526895.1 FAD-dependent oxidoreductase [Kiritimatiellia bacterium]
MTKVDVLIAGAGAGGICAALAAARSGARVLLLEKADQIGGTGVHSPVSLICKFHGTDHRPVNLGIHRELFPFAYLHSTQDFRPQALRLTYDERELYQRYLMLLSAEPLLTVRTGEGVQSVHRDGSRIGHVITDLGREIAARVFIDATANGNLSAMADCRAMKGREGDGALQSATLVFGMGNVDVQKLKVAEFKTRGGLASLWRELSDLYRKAKKEGRTRNPKSSVVAFPYPDGKRLLFNSNEVTGVDPTVPGAEEASKEKGRELVQELIEILREHPAFENATVEFVANKMGIREGRRILGDYILTEQDCLGEARFDDMVAACAYEIDIHDPGGGPTRMVNIPGSGYYHIPYRSLVAADAENLLLGSRCISGTHEAHSSYRVISGVSAVGQAAGTAAALAVRYANGDVRAARPEWIRFVLREQVQFVEGNVYSPPGWKTPYSE